ncbi:MAG: thioredoxin family protein [Desulfobacteraceae bacterium]|nr:thioredoxin family protein [Desulfobacteraceae bacterium]
MKITEQDFNHEVLESDKPVVVEFMWIMNGVCELVSKRVSKVLNKHSNQVKFIQVDYSINEKLKNLYRISEIPTFLFFLKGQLIDSLTGFVSEKEMEDKIENLLNLK